MNAGMAGDAVSREMVDCQGGMTLETKTLACKLHQFQVRAAMRLVAGGAWLGVPIHRHVMLKDKRPPYVGMAGGAGCLFIRNQHSLKASAVYVMAVPTGDLPFQ